ncbi:MAG: hypothetical protein JWP97_1639 [Labilithrix sp.]|nr:hypothetical protein [Labilithrix sp.]
MIGGRPGAALLALVAVAGLAACAGGSSANAPVVTAPPRAPKVALGALEAGPLLGDLPSRVAKLGGGPLAIVASGPMSEGERLGAFVDIPKDACLLAYGRASGSLEDIDLAAFAEEGNPVAVDEGPDPRPTLLLCPPHPSRVYVAAHAASGEGLCVVGAQLVPKERAPEIGRAANAHGTTGSAPRTPEAWPGLEEQVRAHRAAIGGTWEEQRRLAITADNRAVSAVGFTIDEGGCTDALVVPDDDVAIIDVDVLDADGRLVARAKDGGPTRSVTVCSPTAMTGSLQVRPHLGRGLVAAVIARTKIGTAKDVLARADVAWVAPVLPLEQTRAARNAALAKAGYAAPSASASGQLQLGRRLTVPVELAGAAGCTRIDVVAGAPLALLDVAVWDDAGALLASAEGASDTTLFACGRGKARVDLGTRGRPGPFTVLTRAERWRDPIFAAHPLAASRMLGRAAGGPIGTFEGAGGVRQASLDASHQYVQNATVPPGQCLRVAIGVEGEGTGLEARLTDVASGEELDRAHGQTAGLVRACAGAAPRQVRLEVRATAGKLDAVLGDRVTASQ